MITAPLHATGSCTECGQPVDGATLQLAVNNLWDHWLTVHADVFTEMRVQADLIEARHEAVLNKIRETA